MRNAIFLGIAIFIAVLAGGYSITWFAQARIATETAEKLIANVNREQKYITYDKLEATGFPKNLKIVITRPQFSGDLKLLLDEIEAETKKSGRPFRHSIPDKAWLQTISLDGQLIIGTNIFSSKYTLQASGKISATAKIGEKSFQFSETDASPTFCSLNLHRTNWFEDFWNFEAAAKDIKSFAKSFRLFDCAFSAVTLVDNNQKILATSSPSRFYISNTPENDIQHLRIYLNSETEITAEGESLFADFYKSLYPQQTFFKTLAASGKQKLDIDLSYNGPLSVKNNPNPNFDFSLGKFDFSNQIQKSKIHFYLSNNNDGVKNNGKLNTRAEFSFSPQYDIVVRDMIKNFISDAYTSSDPKFMEFQATMSRYTPEEMFSIVNPIIPNFNSLGNVVQSLDLQYSADPSMANAEVTLNDLELSITPYGIKANGAAKRENSGQPTGSANILCRSCNDMIDGIMDYLTRIHNVAVYFSAEKATLLEPNQQLASGIKSFLYDISGSDKINMTFDIASNGAKGITINGKSIAFVIQRYNEYIQPTLRKKEYPQR